MSKECKGKFHGDCIKLIDEKDKYCPICQQQYAILKKRRVEKAKKVCKTIGKAAGVVVAVAGPLIVKALSGDSKTES